MARFLILIVLVYLGWLLVRAIGSKRDRTDVAQRDASEAARPSVEPMLQCAWCGAHVAEGQSLGLPDGRRYCSATHRDAARSIDAPPP